MVIELESVKMRISAPAHPSATDIGRVSGLVECVLALPNEVMPVGRLASWLVGQSREC